MLFPFSVMLDDAQSLHADLSSVCLETLHLSCLAIQHALVY